MSGESTFNTELDLTQEALDFAKGAKRSATLIMFLGVVVAACGLAVLARPLLGGIAVTALLGAAMLVGGIMHVAISFGARIGRGFFGLLGIGIVMILGGLGIMFYPMEGLTALTAVLGVLLLIVGVLRTVFAIRLRGLPGSSGMMLNGILAVLLGVMLFAKFPESSEVVIGVFLGVDLLISGLSMTILASAVRRTMKTVQKVL